MMDKYNVLDLRRYLRLVLHTIVPCSLTHLPPPLEWLWLQPGHHRAASVAQTAAAHRGASARVELIQELPCDSWIFHLHQAEWRDRVLLELNRIGLDYVEEQMVWRYAGG